VLRGSGSQVAGPNRSQVRKAVRCRSPHGAGTIADDRRGVVWIGDIGVRHRPIRTVVGDA
jgi:hypothetical protein